MVRGEFELSSLIPAPLSFLPTNPPLALFTLRLVNISLWTMTEDPQTLFNQSRGLGTHHLGAYIPHPLSSHAVLPLPPCQACPCGRVLSTHSLHTRPPPLPLLLWGEVAQKILTWRNSDFAGTRGLTLNTFYMVLKIMLRIICGVVRTAIIVAHCQPLDSRQRQDLDPWFGKYHYFHLTDGKTLATTCLNLGGF